MPRVARGVLLTGISLVLALILYRWVLRRVFVRLADRSMAMLLERRHRELGGKPDYGSRIERLERLPDSVQTQEMIAETRRQALARVGDVRLANVFNLRPLAISLTGALVLSATMGAFYVVNASAWELGFGRLYLLKNDTWPRNARIEIVGMDLRTEGSAEDDSPIVPFRDRCVEGRKRV